jgi:hypothetical protein
MENQTFTLHVTKKGVIQVPYTGHTLEWLQAQVDGYIEVASNRFDDRSIVVICNEEGLLLNLPHHAAINRERFAGDILIMGECRAHGGADFCGLTEAQCEMVEQSIQVISHA